MIWLVVNAASEVVDNEVNCVVVNPLILAELMAAKSAVSIAASCAVLSAASWVVVMFFN